MIEIIDIALIYAVYFFIFISVIYVFSMIFMTWGLSHIKRYSQDQKHFISVVIAAHNEESFLENCLNCIVQQDYPNNLFEVIIADDRSTDKTSEIIASFCTRYKNFHSVRLARGEKFVPKKTALIKAITLAKGEFIVSTDADCEQPHTWISALNNLITDEIGMVIGHTKYPRPNNLGQGIDALDYFSQRALGVAFVGLGSVYTCTASNFAYRKSIILENLHDFNQLKTRPAEDNFILFCVYKNSSYKIAIADSPDSYVTTNGAQDFSHFLDQRFRWAAYGGNITSRGVKLFFIPFLLYYLSFWVFLFAFIIVPKIFIYLVLSFISKLLVDFIFMVTATKSFHCSYLLKYFLPSSLIHLLLLPIIVIKGNLFSFNWKGQRFCKDDSL